MLLDLWNVLGGRLHQLLCVSTRAKMLMLFGRYWVSRSLATFTCYVHRWTLFVMLYCLKCPVTVVPKCFHVARIPCIADCGISGKEEIRAKPMVGPFYNTAFKLSKLFKITCSFKNNCKGRLHVQVLDFMGLLTENIWIQRGMVKYFPYSVLVYVPSLRWKNQPMQINSKQNLHNASLH